MRVFNIDITRNGISPVVQVTEYDAMSRFFTLVLRNGSADYEPPENPTYSVWYKTKDSTGWYDTITLPDESTRPAVVADGNAFTIEIAEQATTSCGELALMINGDDGYQLTVSGIITRSDDIPGYDGEEVENYYNVYITEMRENAARAENAADIAVAYGATVEVDEDAQQLNITHHSDTEGGVGWLFGSAIMTSAEGSVAAFSDGANDVAVKSLVATINPVQSGSGDPSPTNIRPISGRTGLTVTAAGKNLCPTQTIVKTGNSYYISGINDYLPFHAGTYTLSNAGTSAYAYWQKEGTEEYNVIHTGSTNVGTFTLEENCNIRLWFYTGTADATFTNIQIEFGTSATAYEPYTAKTYPISWQTEAGAVYGGTLDVVSGVLTVDKVLIDLGSITNWRYNIGNTGAFDTNGNLNPIAKNNDCICTNYKTLANPTASGITSDDNFVCINKKDDGTQYTGYYAAGILIVKDSRYSDVETFKAAMNGVMLCYTITTPQTYQLTPTEVRTILGGNNIYTDAGAVSVTYVADTKKYIDNKIAELQALVLENN